MNVKLYRFIAKGNVKKGGVLYSPKSWPYPIAVDGQEVKNWESLVVELKDGIYRPFQLCVGGANMVNQDLKDLLQSFIGINNDVEFLPIRAISEIYGEQTYYIMHFNPSLIPYNYFQLFLVVFIGLTTYFSAMES